ncbi:uncharacterized protein VTP21DRAFT_591 [Calcarisporiella thermophila]|uniref:uncharacterized protein n=1 Tax=Calcarisporiella thermophila TaxID=911321 RepID=UPI00374229AE
MPTKHETRGISTDIPHRPVTRSVTKQHPPQEEAQKEPDKKRTQKTEEGGKRKREKPGEAEGERLEEDKKKTVKKEQEGPEKKARKTEATKKEGKDIKSAGGRDSKVKEENQAETKRESKGSKASTGMKLEAATHTELESTMEKGHIYYFYRPKVKKSEVSDADDIQRFYFVLKPTYLKRDDKEYTAETGVNDKVSVAKYRLIVIGKKRLPEVEAHGRYFGFVRKATHDLKELNDLLGKEEYDTQTRGHRTLEPCRPCGYGVYSIIPRHLAYELTIPHSPGEVQEELNIEKVGSFVISIKNPEGPAPPNLGLSSGQKAEFPEDLLERFKGRRFIPLEDTSYLEYDGCEILLIGARSNVKHYVGTELDEMEKEDEIVVEHLGPEHAIFKQLSMQEKPTAPLFGDWE